MISLQTIKVNGVVLLARFVSILAPTLWAREPALHFCWVCKIDQSLRKNVGFPAVNKEWPRNWFSSTNQHIFVPRKAQIDLPFHVDGLRKLARIYF